MPTLSPLVANSPFPTSAPVAPQPFSPAASTSPTMSQGAAQPFYSMPEPPATPAAASLDVYTQRMAPPTEQPLNLSQFPIANPASLITPPGQDVAMTGLPMNSNPVAVNGAVKPNAPTGLNASAPTFTIKPKAPWYQVLLATPVNGALAVGGGSAVAGFGLTALLQAIGVPTKAIGALLLGVVGATGGYVVGKFNQTVNRG